MSSRIYIEQAIHLFGSEKKLAVAIGYSQNAVWRAKTLGRTSSAMAARIEAVTRARKAVIHRDKLCPDFKPLKVRADGTLPPRVRSERDDRPA